MKAPSRLRTQLMLLVGFSVLPAFLLVSFGAWETRTEAQANAQLTAERLVQSAVSEQAALMESARQLLSVVSRLPEVRATGRSCRKTLANLLQLYARYTNLGAIALDGSVLCSALPFDASVNLGDRTYFRRAVATRAFAVGDYQVGRITGKPSVNFGHPVVDEHGDVKAVVFGALDLTWLGDLLADQQLPTGSVITLFDSHDTVLAKYPPEGPVSASIDGELAYSEPLDVGAAGSASIEVRVPYGAIFAPIKQRFMRDLSLLGLVAAIAFTIAWFASNALVLRRVNALVGAAKRLGEGHLGARAGLAPGKDELGRLAAAFDRMAADLEGRELALQSTADELRTANRALRTLSGGNRALLRAQDEQWLVAEVCRVVVEVGKYPGALIAFTDAKGPQFFHVVAQAGILDADNICHADALRSVAETAQAQVLRDRQDRATLALPLSSAGEGVLGILAILGPEAEFDASERELLTETADDLAFGIRTLRMQQRAREAHDRIHQMEWYDPLTGLPNRAYLRRELEELLDQRRDGQRPLALLLFDLDRFREINTGLGYAQGDQVLQAIGPRLRSALPKSALIAHLGEDEFAVVLAEADAGDAVDAARLALEALEAPIVLGEFPLDVTGSLGVAVYPGHGRDPEALIRAADAAMYRAKLGRRGFAVYTPSRDQVTPERLTLAGELRRAIEAEQLELYCQPKVDLRTRAVSSTEALVRWRHPERGQIPPGAFIPLAEETGLIGPLTEWVLNAAARQQYLWREQGLVMPIAVNISARNLLESNLVPRVETLLATWGIEAKHIGLELTESALMQDPEHALETLTKLHRMGVRLYIDDFGTGYSSLSYLQKLPVDAIKIDQSFVFGMAENTDSYRIVESTIALAHKLGKRVVAEGVESDHVLQLLAGLDCDAAQGYYISRPMLAERLKQWLETAGSAWAGSVPSGASVPRAHTS